MKKSNLCLCMLLIVSAVGCTEKAEHIDVLKTFSTDYYEVSIEKKHLKKMTKTGDDGSSTTVSYDGGKAEGDTVYQLTGDLKFITSSVGEFVASVPDSLDYIYDLNIHFKSKEAKDIQLQEALNKSVDTLLSLYNCSDNSELMDSFSSYYLTIQDDQKFERESLEVKNQIRKAEAINEGTINKIMISTSKAVFYEVSLREIVDFLNGELVKTYISIDNLESHRNRRVSMIFGKPLNIDRLQNKMSEMGLNLQVGSEKNAMPKYLNCTMR